MAKVKGFRKRLQHLSLAMNIAEIHGIDILIKSMETYEKI